MFDKKPRGVNGRDSRCKSCISKQKALHKKRKRAEQMRKPRSSRTVLNLKDFTIERRYLAASEEESIKIMKDLIDKLMA